MRHARFLLAFVLGACATAAIQSGASTPPADAPPQMQGTPAVVPLSEADLRVNPPGTGRVALLATGKNAFVGKLELDPEAKVPVHRDPTEEFIHILRGDGTITIQGRDYPVSAGTTVYMPAHAEVSYQNGDNTLVAIQVFAGPEPAKKYDSWKQPDSGQ